MHLEPGQTLGPYVVEAAAGSGGMGEVYKARDTRLNRLVALKVIGTLSGDRSEWRRRFADEARAIAALNHPHICALYDTGLHDDRDFLVLEYLHGETLAQRLARGALPLRETLEIAIAIAEALDCAHRQGIVHRDLKPANIFLTRSHGPKLLDFGLAALRVTANRGSRLEGLTTAPLEVASSGTIEGTLHYLAPERFDGHEADARSDIFAFGAVLYETITNRKAFDEKNEARLIAAILSSEPPAIDAKLSVPPALLWVVQNCLVKDPDGRWQSMGDVAKVLRQVVTTNSPEKQPPRPRRRQPLWIGGAMVAGAALAAAVLTLGGPTDSAGTIEGPISLAVVPPADTTFALTESTARSAQFALAPAGNALVFVGTTAGVRQLWVQELRGTDARVLEGTNGASYPFWSPDGQFIGFFAEGLLKKVSVHGRAPQPICKAVNGRGGTWREDGTIVFSPDTEAALSSVSAASGTPQPLTQRGLGHLAHRWPQFLENGRLLFFVRSNEPDVQGIYLTSIDKPSELRRLRATASSGAYASGRLLFVAEGELLAQPFNLSTGSLSGEAVPLGLKVGASSVMNSAMSVSRRDVIATWNAGGLSDLVWHDRRGMRRGNAHVTDRYVDFRLAPDERRLAVARVDPARNTADLAILDLERRALTPLTTSSQTDATPVWSANGERLVFRSNRYGLHDLFIRPAHAGADEQLLHTSGFGMYPTDWSSDGTSIIFHMLHPLTKHDIWSLNPTTGVARALLETAAQEVQGQLSASGRLAYTSNQLGALHVYVRTLDGTAESLNASPNGGFDPRWRADGRELFFISQGMLMAADVSVEGRLEVREAKPLFPIPIQQTSAPYLSDFVVSRDGQRFLIKVPADPPGAGPITVTLNWPERLPASFR